MYASQGWGLDEQDANDWDYEEGMHAGDLISRFRGTASMESSACLPRGFTQIHSRLHVSHGFCTLFKIPSLKGGRGGEAPFRRATVQFRQLEPHNWKHSLDYTYKISSAVEERGYSCPHCSDRTPP